MVEVVRHSFITRMLTPSSRIETITPMKLKAFLSIVDPDKIISNGDKSSQLTVTWYENSESTQITSENSNYTLNADGTLLVKKNVSPTTPVQILCRAYLCGFQK